MDVLDHSHALFYILNHILTLRTNGKRWYAVCTDAEGYTLIAEFTEAETGKDADAIDRRPQLAAALAAGKTAKCPVIECQARSALPRRRIHRRAHGSEGRVHRHRTGR